MNNHLARLSTLLSPYFDDCSECGDLLLHCGEAWPYPCRYDERQVVKFKTVRAIISNIEMHRKYTTSKTNVINAYNYLIQAQSKDNKQAVLFHQILVANEYAPLLLNERHLQNYIGQNENQNVVSQNKAGFQTYFDGNLIQIGIRRGVRILTEIKRLEFKDMLGLLNALNLDYALAVKQIISNNRYKQREGLNHCCKFYQNFMLKEGNSETTVPFMEVQPHKVHYYDIYYGSVFPKPSQKTSKSELSTPKNQNSSAKKLKLKSGVSIPTTISQNPLVNEQTSFKRYLLFLSILFSADEPNQVIQYLKNSLLESKFEQQFKLRIDKLAKQTKESSLSCLAQLFLKCLSKPEEYNIHIFQKECQLLKDKYLKLKDKTNTYLIAQKDTKDLFREDRQKVSKSMITPPSSKHSQLCSKDQIVSSRHKRTNGRLRYSKSEIKLDKSVGKNSFSQGRKLKKATLKMFKDSKIEPSNPLSTLIEQTTKANKNQKMNNESCFGFARNSFNFIKISSNCQNWLNYSSMKEQQVNAKLRSFKKGSYLSTINVSPQTSIPRQDVVHEVQEEKQQGNWQIIDRFSRSKAILFKKQQETKVNKMERQSKQQTQDQFTMTDSKEEANQIGSNKSELDNKNIINTLNIKLFRQQRRKDSQIIPEPPKQKIPESPKIKKNSPLAATKQLNQVKQKPEARKQSRQPEKSARVQEQRLQTPITTPKANELSKSKLSPNNSAHKISQMIKKSTFQSIQNSFTDEIQQIAFKSKQKGCLQDKNYSQKSKESTKLLQDLGRPKNNLKPTQEKSSEVRALQRNRVARPSQPKQSGKLGVVLQQAQKVFYKKHFQSILAFFKLNLSKINSTPHISNLVYLINILYYKDMIETLKSQSNTKYQQLAELIAKKQTKIPEQRKNSYLLFRVDLDQMYEWSKKVVELQSMINKGAPIEKIQQQLQLGDQLSAFLQLTHQACLLIDQILAQTYSYMQTNKAMLLSKDLFAILLQLCYSVTITRIICQQRLKYYTMVEGNSLQGVFNVFTFQFNQNENQYLAEYQKKLAERDMTFFNVIEEFTSLKVWVQGFA